MEGDKAGNYAYMDDFAAECLAQYGEGYSTDSLSSDRTLIWPLSEQGNCRYKIITDTESREYKKRLKTGYFTTDYVESMRTPMSELLKQISNLQPIKQQQQQQSKDAWIDKDVAWIDRKVKKENALLVPDISN